MGFLAGQMRRRACTRGRARRAICAGDTRSATSEEDRSTAWSRASVQRARARARVSLIAVSRSVNRVNAILFRIIGSSRADPIGIVVGF